MVLPDIQTFERASLKAWPGIEVDWDGAWVRRASNGYTQRANSAQCFDPADDDRVEERIAAAVAWFQSRNLKPIFRVNKLSGPRLNAALDAQGWVDVDHSHMFAMPLRPVTADPRGTVFDLDDPVFLGAQQQLRNYDDSRLAKLRSVLGAMTVPGIGIVVHAPDGRPVASALMAVADGIVITGNVVTDSTERRKGYGSAMMRTGLAWAHANGASIAALNVAAENAPAHALYKGLGYAHQYDYVYRVPPQ